METLGARGSTRDTYDSVGTVHVQHDGCSCAGVEGDDDGGEEGDGLECSGSFVGGRCARGRKNWCEHFTRVRQRVFADT